MQTTRGTSLSEPHQHTHRREAAHRPHRLPLVLAVAALVIALDVVSKVIVVAKLSDRGPVRLLGGFLKLEETRNPGAAFSIGTGTTIVFAVVAIAVIVVILRTASRLVSLPWSIVLGMLLGGAAGNLIDRLARSPGVFRGWVVDWIALPHFAVFNLADSAITVGAVLAVLLALTGRQFDGTVNRQPARSGAARRAEPAVTAEQVATAPPPEPADPVAGSGVDVPIEEAGA